MIQHHMSIPIKLNNTKTLWIIYVISKNSSTLTCFSTFYCCF